MEGINVFVVMEEMVVLILSKKEKVKLVKFVEKKLKKEMVVV